MYLDAASSEPLHPAARETLLAALDTGYADPRRLHRPARNARLLLDNARAVVAECLEVRSDEVTFTASGTAAVHSGLLGLARARRARGDVVVLSDVEHSSVRHAATWGGTPRMVGVDSVGRVSVPELVEAAHEPGVAVCALQSANHEVGTVQPVGDLRLPADVPLFVDARASMGRRPLPRGWDALAGSAHHWGGPAGVGVLLVRDGDALGEPVPRGRPDRPPQQRLRERPRGAGRRRCPPGGGGRARRGQGPPARARRPHPGRCRRPARHRGGRRPGRTARPTW